MNENFYRESYNVLIAVLKDSAYSNIEIGNVSNENRQKVTKIVYGILENYFYLDFAVNSFCEKKPKVEIRTLLYIGFYTIHFLKQKEYSAVDSLVNVTAEVTSEYEKNFVNAILRKAIQNGLPSIDKKSKLAESVEFNAPKWLIDVLKIQYPKAYKRILSSNVESREHIRIRGDLDESLVLTAIESKDIEKTETGYFVTVNEKIKELFNRGVLTFQGLTSSKVVNAMGDVNGKNILDACSAPGGKACYLSEKGAKVTATDIHPHRVDLINAYAYRMHQEIETGVMDACQFLPEFVEKFDIVLCDVPCSGIGVLSKRKDIIINRKLEDIESLSKLQENLINNLKNYVKIGGVLFYSTCTVMRKENEENVERFLKENKNFQLVPLSLDFENDGMIQFLPNGKGQDGFFMAKLVRNE